MNYTGLINIVLDGKIILEFSYKYNADMYLHQIVSFFKDNDKDSIIDMFKSIKYINLKQYEEYVKLAGLHDEYDFNENIWKDQNGNKKFNMLYQELDNRCFINLITGKNDFEILLETDRKFIPNKQQFVNEVDFKYIINLNEYKLGVNSLYYDPKVIDL